MRVSGRVSGTNRQNGYTLLLMLLFLIGAGGVVATGFTQDAKRQVDHERFLHNKRVLEEAKRALLQFAYNYPVTNQRGPGRLPCADTDNDGTPNPLFGTCIQLGRLPWNQPNLNLYDIRDADGERLWYAVSSNFATNVAVPNFINSDAFGTITLRDQVGNIIYDASGGGEGVAAVIIAPGAITARNGVSQDRSVGNGDDPFDTTADTDAGIINPVNYLDLLFGIEDNAVFGQGSTNGFILGRVDDLTEASVIVNDQIAVITTREIVAVAEKATLQAYQQAVNGYRNNIGVDAYPWLDDYVTQVTVLDDYDGDVGTRLGRVPSIFANYFAPSPAPSQSIVSDLEMIGVQPLTVNGFPVPIFDPGVISANADVAFNAAGDLIITPTVNGASIVRYYWDEELAADGWLECLPVVTGTEQDCNQAAANPGVPDSTIVPNQLATQVVRVTYANNLVTGAPFTRLLSGGAGLDPVYQAPTAAGHARVYFEYSEAFVDEIGVDFKYDNYYFASLDDILLGNVNYQLGVIYYPELPDWPLAAEDDWHDSIQMVYAGAFTPGNAAVNCTPAPPAPPGNDCITVANIGGVKNDKIAVLTLASEHNFVDEAADGFSDDLIDIFDLGNDDSDDDFDVRAGNDVIQVMR